MQTSSVRRTGMCNPSEPIGRKWAAEESWDEPVRTYIKIEHLIES